MKSKLILEINRIKEVMGLLSEQEQVSTNTDEWKSYAGGKPYQLFELKATQGSKTIVNSNLSQDTIIGWKNSVQYRIPENKLTDTLKNNYGNWVSKPIVDGFFYTTKPAFGNLKSEKNPDYIQWVGNMLNQNRSLPTHAYSEGGKYWGATIPGITPEIKLGFMKYIENYVKYNHKDNYDKASRKVQSIIIKKGKLTTQESEKLKPTPDSIYSQFQLRGTEGEVFKDNSTELGEGTKKYIDDTKALIQQIINENPGAVPKIVNKVLINGKETDSTYTIYTSASRFRNTGNAANLTFAQLSELRAKSVDTYIRQQLGNLVEFPQPKIIAEGTNGDGSSGPNPLKPYAFFNQSGKLITSGDTGRDDFGAPLSDKNIYEQFKYCNLIFAISFGVEGTKTEVPSGKILGPFSILIDDEKERKRIKIPPIKFIPFSPNGGGSGGGWMPCDAYN